MESFLVIAVGILGIADAWRLSSVVRAGGTFHDVVGPDRYLGAISVGLLFCGIWTLVKNLKGVRHPPLRKEEDGGESGYPGGFGGLCAGSLYFCDSNLGLFVGNLLFIPGHLLHFRSSTLAKEHPRRVADSSRVLCHFCVLC